MKFFIEMWEFAKIIGSFILIILTIGYTLIGTWLFASVGFYPWWVAIIGFVVGFFAVCASFALSFTIAKDYGI